MPARKVVLSCAVTGSVHTPTMSPYIPITPQQIADEAVRAAQAGAAAVHIHVRNPETGEPSSDPELFYEVLSKIKARSNVIICPTAGGNYRQSDEERIQVVTKYKPELASLDIASMNYGVFLLANKYKDWKFEWEERYLRNTESTIFPGTYTSLRFFAQRMAENGTVPEIEVFDTGGIYNAKYFVDTGVLKKPLWMQFGLGIMGGAPCTVESLVHLVNTAKSCFGEALNWSVIPASITPFAFLAAALAMGGHIRTGMEDTLYLNRGQLAKSNGELCEKAVRMIHEMGFEVATPDEARALIGTKGSGQVGF